MAIKPLEDRVVIKIEQAEQTTASGLVIPETAKEKPQEARVVAVGPGRVDEKGNRIPVDIKEGDVSCSPATVAPRSSTRAKST